MANSVVFRFVAIDKFKPVADKMGRNLDKITSKTKRLNKETKNTGMLYKKVGQAGGFAFGQIAAGIGAVLGVSKAVDVAASFEDAIADLSAITGAAGKELKFLTDETLRLAKAGAVAQNDVAAAFKGVASAKSELLEDLPALSKVTEQVILLSNTGVDLATATDTVTKSLNQFSAGADQATKFVDVLAKGAQIGASEVVDTGEAVEKAGAVAKSVGVDFAQLNAAIQVLAKGGVKGSEAGTMLKTVLLNLATQDIPKLNPKIVGLTKAFENLSKANLDTAQMKKLFGSEAIVAGEILGENNKLLAKWSEEIKGVGSAQAQAGIRLNTFNARMRRMGVVISTKIIKLFERLEPVITKNVKAFGEWIDGINPKSVERFADSVKLVASAFGTVAKVVGGVLRLLERIGKIIGETAGAIATGSFKEFNSKLLTESVQSVMFGEPPKAPTSEKGQLDVNVNLNAPEGTVNSIKTAAKGSAKNMNVGSNMVTQ